MLAGKLFLVGCQNPRYHVNSVQLSFNDTTLLPPSLPAGASAHVSFIRHPFFCFRLPLLLLASFSFSTEDSFSHVLNPSLFAVPLRWLRSAAHNPIFSCLNFALLSPLFAQAIPQDDRWSLLVLPEPDCSSGCIVEEGRSCYCRLSL